MDTATRRIAYACILLMCTFTLVFSCIHSTSRMNATISFIDVGQGDSILIQSPSGKQLLVDGGRSKSVLSELENLLPYFDRSIDVVIGTHPDADHIGGLPYVVQEYEVGALFEPGSSSDSKIYTSLEKSVSDKKIPHLYARENMVIDFGDDSYFVFLFPNQDVRNWETNNSSIVGMYVYKDTSFLLTGDAPIATESYLIKKYPTLTTDVLKLGHHGSRTSSSEGFLKSIHPGLAIISAGKGNSYGHPHQEVVERLSMLDIPSFSTIDFGTITLNSNGNTIKLKH